MALRSVEHLPSASSTSTATSQHIVCTKYRISSGKQGKTGSNGSSSPMPSRSQVTALSSPRDLPESTTPASSFRLQAASATTPGPHLVHRPPSDCTPPRTLPQARVRLSVDEFHNAIIKGGIVLNETWLRERRSRVGGAVVILPPGQMSVRMLALVSVRTGG